MRPCPIRDEDTHIGSLDRTNLKLLEKKSSRKEENEVLLPPGMTFKIDKIVSESEKLTKIYITLNPECDFLPDPDNPLIGIKKSIYISKGKHFYRYCVNSLEDWIKSKDIKIPKEILIFVKKQRKIIFPLDNEWKQPFQLEKNVRFK